MKAVDRPIDLSHKNREKLICGIYRIESPSGKIYIGQTAKFNKRTWYYKRGYCKSQPILYKSIQKYGWDRHKCELIQELPPDVSYQIMYEYEDLYITQYREVGYKLLNAREAGLCGSFSAEARKNMSIAQSGKIPTAETIARLRYLTNNKSQECRRKISESFKGNKYRLGIPHTKESLVKMSNASKRFIYEISNQLGQVYTTDNMGAFCAQYGLTSQNLGNTFRGKSADGYGYSNHKGYKIISKTPIK